MKMLKASVLALIAGILFLVLTGCETTSPSSTVKSKTKKEEQQPREEPIEGLQIDENSKYVLSFTALAELPESSISPPMRGNPHVSFGAIDKSAGIGVRKTSGGSAVIFPIHDTGGSVGFCKEVGIPKLQVIQLEDGRVRIFVRVQNMSNSDISVEVKCVTSDYKDSDDYQEHIYEDVIFKREIFRDFSFIINGPASRRFTILVNKAKVRVSR